MEKKEVIYSKENVKKVLSGKGFPIDSRTMYVNLIGIRNSETLDRPNFFDDTLVVMVYRLNGLAIFHYDITTEPGLFYLNDPLNEKGTAVLKEGHYKNCWAQVLHKEIGRAHV